MTIYLTRLKTNIHFLVSTFFCVLFLIPLSLIAQNNKKPQPRDSVINTTSPSVFKDPNFQGAGRNTFLQWSNDGPGSITLGLIGHSVIPYVRIYYQGFNPTDGTSYIKSLENKFYAYNAKKNPGNVTEVKALPANLVNTPEQWGNELATPKGDVNTANAGSVDKTNAPEKDDDYNLKPASISKNRQGGYTLTLDGKPHDVFRPILKQQSMDTTAQKKFYDAAPLASGGWVEIPKTGNNVIVYLFANEQGSTDKGKVTITPMAKEQFGQAWIIPGGIGKGQ